MDSSGLKTLVLLVGASLSVLQLEVLVYISATLVLIFHSGFGQICVFFNLVGENDGSLLLSLLRFKTFSFLPP